MTPGGAMRDIWFLATDVTVLALLVLLTASAGVAWWLRRTGRSDRHYALIFVAFAAIAPIVAVTLVRGELHFAPGQLLNWSSTGWQRISYNPFGSSQALLNVALFVPAGAAWTLLTGRPLRVLTALVGLSFLVECLQAVTGLGANDVADIMTNSAGAAFGVFTGALALRIRPRPGGPSRPSRRQVTLAAVSVVVLGVASVIGIFVGAEYRQASLEKELADRFAGTSLELYSTWEAEDTLYEEVFDAVSVFTDGTQYLDNAIRVRYPASFFGLQRCVFVEWTPGTARVFRDAGTRCSEFIG